MNDETLNYANRLRGEMEHVEKVLNRIEKKDTMVEIMFNNSGYGCGSIGSDYISDKEVSEIKSNLVKLIRVRAETRLEELKKNLPTYKSYSKMIKVTTPDELHRVLAKMDEMGVVWCLGGHKASWNEDILAERLFASEILLEIVPHYDARAGKLIRLISWQQPMTADEFLQDHNDE